MATSTKYLVNGIASYLQARMQGDQAREDAEERSKLSQAQLGQTLADTLAKRAASQLNDAKTAEINTSLEAQKPENVRRNAMIGFGIPLEDEANVANHAQTGWLGGKYEKLPDDVAGPWLPDPDWMSKLSPLQKQVMASLDGIARGDKNSENVAKAATEYSNQERVQQVLDGKLPASSFAQAIAASQGKSMVTGHEWGVVNNFTGDVNDGNPVAQRFGNVRKSEVGKNNANATESLAGAGLKRAQTAKTQQEIAQGKAGSIQQSDQGIVIVDPRTATARPVIGADGQPLGPKLKDIPASVNTAIVNNVMNLSKAQKALDLLNGNDVGDVKGAKDATGLKAYAPQAVLNWLDPRGVEARAALTDVGSLVLHDRSGAAVTASEFPRLMPFIPQPTDSPDVARKKMKRFVDIYKDELRATNEIYSSANGYKENPVIRRMNEERKDPGAAERAVNQQKNSLQRQVTRTGTASDGRKVVEFSDGSIEYAN
ncbi:hypothetical protein [Rhodoferax mekongensis]|uniref:hypothetical protein n=1 Tax=Rhodoferax mekongensis TaxID=3068341 RepID=UPI0028BE416A|nr:hypothetical protein [Rhodoferax sp. TBRC 17199]MDT7514686.1 hypothetical protein [Rhodoferax sp. TBRC 17199]